MPTSNLCHQIPPGQIWAGRILSAVVILFLIFDGAIKLVPIAAVKRRTRNPPAGPSRGFRAPRSLSSARPQAGPVGGPGMTKVE
jgi:hypothetical protein